MLEFHVPPSDNGTVTGQAVVAVSYSLVNASAVAHDLVRLPHGVQVGEVLRTALACGSGDLAALAVRHPGPHRASRWDRLQQLGVREPARQVVAAAGEA